MGDRYLRKLLVVILLRDAAPSRESHSDALRLWASGMLERKTVKYKFNLTAVALANKVARIVFVLMTRGEPVRRSASRGLSERGYSIGRFFAAEGDQHRGAPTSDVNQRKRLGRPNSGQSQYERASE